MSYFDFLCIGVLMYALIGNLFSIILVGDALVTTEHARVPWARDYVFYHLIGLLYECHNP